MKTKKTKIEILRQIVSEHQYQKIEGQIVDGVTANMLLTVYDNINEENQKKFISLPISKMVAIGWKLCK